MTTPTSNSVTRSAARASRQANNVNKACMPCRTRKVKCDAGVIGLPCSSCTSRQSAQECAVPVRKDRTRSVDHRCYAPCSTNRALTRFNLIGKVHGFCRLRAMYVQDSRSKRSPTSSPAHRQSPRQADPDLLYLNILNEAVEAATESRRHSDSPHCSRPEDNLAPHDRLWSKLPQLDDVDNDYLVKKGVFDLPLPHLLNDFVRSYESGDCSLLLVRVILVPTSLQVPEDVLSACGFATRSAAHESFFSKAKLLYDFYAEEDPLLMLQASIILCLVILDHPTDWNFDYWFHNAIRLATKVGLHDLCAREDQPSEVLKLYRRIWWTLYSLDVFHISVDTRRSRLLRNTSAIQPRAEDDWELDDVSGALSDLLPTVIPQQKASPVLHCELSQIFEKCLSLVTKRLPQDPCQMLQPLDSWRQSLVAKIHMTGNIETDVYYLNIRAMSYRYECILCRLMRRCWQQSSHPDWYEWAKQRLQSATLELDTIAVRVMASGTLREFPMGLTNSGHGSVTTIPLLLAFHIESALNPAETDLVRSMARISISQTMLVLSQGRDIPVLKRALPVFEDILTKKNLYSGLPNHHDQGSAHPQPQESSAAAATVPFHAQIRFDPSRPEQWENGPLMDVDLLGFDFLDEWQIGQLGFPDRF
nr:fusaric acid cluster transcription factor fub12 [Quercus suber]